jgi:diaminopimelate epimerase
MVGNHGAGVKTGTVFYKMTGSGNDFVMLDGRYIPLREVTPELVAAICNGRVGVGADGVILLDPDAPQGTHFAFHFWNSDGSPGPMCGNGALCATRLAALIELAPSTGDVRFSTPAGTHRGRVVDDVPEIHLPDCLPPRRVPAVATAQGERNPIFVAPSVPHLVLVVDDVDKVPLEQRGPLLRHDKALGDGGANVNWISKGPDGRLRMRTYERGVEAETLACGTGAVACALALEEAGEASAPLTVWTRTGLPLEVSWALRDKSISSIVLRGEGRLVYRGILGDVLSRSHTNS